MIWLGHSGGGGGGVWGRGGGGCQSIRGSEMMGLRGGGVDMVGWYNTGQEESILLTVRIHLVRTKRSQKAQALQ